MAPTGGEGEGLKPDFGLPGRGKRGRGTAKCFTRLFTPGKRVENRPKPTIPVQFVPVATPRHIPPNQATTIIFEAAAEGNGHSKNIVQYAKLVHLHRLGMDSAALLNHIGYGTYV